jgi:hypothetical protein
MPTRVALEASAGAARLLGIPAVTAKVSNVRVALRPWPTPFPVV